MNYLLDTNALSEITKRRPNQGYLNFVASIDELNFYTSCIAIGELQKGVECLKDVSLKKRLQSWVDDTVEGFESRVLPVETKTGKLWGGLSAQARKEVRTLPIIDALIAAQCLVHNLTLVTRNTKDFTGVKGLKVQCPWDDPVASS